MGVQFLGIQSAMFGSFLLGLAAFWLLAAVACNKAIVDRFPWIVGWLPFAGVISPANRLLSLSRLVGLHIRIVDVAIDGCIEDRTFEDCSIYGPAILIHEGYADHRNCDYFAKVDDLHWLVKEEELQAAGERLGAIHVKNCVFIRCRFHNVGFVGTPSSLAQFSSQTKVVSSPTVSSPPSSQ